MSPEQPTRRAYKVRTAATHVVLAAMLDRVADEGWEVLTVLHDGVRFIIVTFRLVRQ